MARSRNIKPGFFRNDKLAECGPIPMLVFAGLWCLADFRGNLEYRPKRIKIDTIPYFNGIEGGIDYGIDSGIDECIDLLQRAGFVYRYSIDDTEYLHICNFLKHQNPHKNERDSGTSIPEPIKDGIKTEVIPNNDEAIVLIPDSFIPDSLVPNGIDQSISFDTFWEAYPRKTNKAKAESAWKKLKPDENLFDLITKNITARLQVGDWDEDRKDYIPHPSTYLNGRRWEDEVIRKNSNGDKHGNFRDRDYKTGSNLESLDWANG